MFGGVIFRVRNSISLVVTALAVGTVLSGPCSALEGQAASLIGIVLEEGSERVLSGATLTMMEAQLEVVSDLSGQFTFPDLPPSSQLTLRATLDGYVSVAFDIDTSEISFIQLRLPPFVAVLDELLAVVERGSGSRWSGNSEVTVQPNDDFSQESAADLLASHVPGLDLPSMKTGIRKGGMIVMRGESSFSQGATPAIYLDGARLGSDDGGFLVLEMIPATSVERIRIFRGPSASARYPDTANGVILIETVRGRPSGTERERAGND